MSIQDLIVLRGRVASEVAAFKSEEEGAKPFARFRMVVPRARRKDNGDWEEGESLWYSVRTWGSLATHVQMSLRKGQAVIVVGRPHAQAWIAKDGSVKAEIAISATTVGHDLVFSLSSAQKLERAKPGGSMEGNLEESNEDGFEDSGGTEEEQYVVDEDGVIQEPSLPVAS